MHDIIFANRKLTEGTGIQPIRLLFTHRPIRSQMDAIWNVFTPKLTDFVPFFLFSAEYCSTKCLDFDVKTFYFRLFWSNFLRVVSHHINLLNSIISPFCCIFASFIFCSLSVSERTHWRNTQSRWSSCNCSGLNRFSILFR